jgi:hypothetical protein
MLALLFGSHETMLYFDHQRAKPASKAEAEMWINPISPSPAARSHLLFYFFVSSALAAKFPFIICSAYFTKL